mmetsp:Transcript_69481/g.219929  ORF Transcript_69481/g.219929 Transcript_69481/m.219929 type:complete len:241 (-) Transcript_69481:126-848(-)
MYSSSVHILEPPDAVREVLVASELGVDVVRVAGAAEGVFFVLQDLIRIRSSQLRGGPVWLGLAGGLRILGSSRRVSELEADLGPLGEDEARVVDAQRLGEGLVRRFEIPLGIGRVSLQLEPVSLCGLRGRGALAALLEQPGRIFRGRDPHDDLSLLPGNDKFDIGPLPTLPQATALPNLHVGSGHLPQHPQRARPPLEAGRVRADVDEEQVVVIVRGGLGGRALQPPPGGRLVTPPPGGG